MAIKTITLKNLEANRFSDKNKFRDFASPIWEEAKKDNLTPKDIDEIIHQVRFVRSSSNVWY